MLFNYIAQNAATHSGTFVSPPAANFNVRPKKEGKNEENGHKSSTCTYVFLFDHRLVAVTICQPTDFV